MVRSGRQKLYVLDCSCSSLRSEQRNPARGGGLLKVWSVSRRKDFLGGPI